MLQILRILAVSVISTIKVLWPEARSSAAPTLVKTRSTIPIRADWTGYKTSYLGHEDNKSGLP